MNRKQIDIFCLGHLAAKRAHTHVHTLSVCVYAFVYLSVCMCVHVCE